MTHSLHRQGKIDSLKEDYVVLTFGTSRSAQVILSTPKLLLCKKSPRFYEILKGIYQKLGIPLIRKTIIKLRQERGINRPLVLNSNEELFRCLKKLKEANSGKSVVVSGIIDEVNSCLKKIKLCPHTIQYSLGYFGKAELLPREEVLEITTMCGHHMVSPMLVEKMVDDVKRGRSNPEEAAQTMTKLCFCGIFKNRATKIINSLVK